MANCITNKMDLHGVKFLIRINTPSQFPGTGLASTGRDEPQAQDNSAAGAALVLDMAGSNKLSPVTGSSSAR